eukprot:344259-Prymnesium_polylepis.1
MACVWSRATATRDGHMHVVARPALLRSLRVAACVCTWAWLAVRGWLWARAWPHCRAWVAVGTGMAAHQVRSEGLLAEGEDARPQQLDERRGLGGHARLPQAMRERAHLFTLQPG